MMKIFLLTKNGYVRSIKIDAKNLKNYDLVYTGYIYHGKFDFTTNSFVDTRNKNRRFHHIDRIWVKKGTYSIFEHIVFSGIARKNHPHAIYVNLSELPSFCVKAGLLDHREVFDAFEEMIKDKFGSDWDIIYPDGRPEDTVGIAELRNYEIEKYCDKLYDNKEDFFKDLKEEVSSLDIRKYERLPRRRIPDKRITGMKL